MSNKQDLFTRRIKEKIRGAHDEFFIGVTDYSRNEPRKGKPYWCPHIHGVAVTTDEEALKKILTEPKNALVKQYQRLFEMENTELTFQDEALNVVARKAIDRRTGARGLRSIMEGILLDTMFDLPGLEGVEQVVIGPEVVDGKARPLYIYSEWAEKSGASA